jgi:hypothetical protein
LGAAQRAALELIFAGKSVAETAREAGVNRRTIHRWIKNDPVFAAAYNEWREEIEENCAARLAAMADKAAAAIEKALEAGDARSALQLLKGLGVLRPREKAATDAAEVEKRMKMETRKRKLELESEERDMERDDRMSRELGGMFGGKGG